MARGDYAEAAALLTEALTLAEERGDALLLSVNPSELGEVALDQGDDARAVALLERAIALQQRVGDKVNLTNSVERSDTSPRIHR